MRVRRRDDDPKSNSPFLGIHLPPGRPGLLTCRPTARGRTAAKQPPVCAANRPGVFSFCPQVKSAWQITLQAPGAGQWQVRKCAWSASRQKQGPDLARFRNTSEESSEVFRNRLAIATSSISSGMTGCQVKTDQHKTFEGNSLRSRQVEAIKVHHLVPGSYKVMDELLLRARTSIDFSQGAELGV